MTGSAGQAREDSENSGDKLPLLLAYAPLIQWELRGALHNAYLHASTRPKRHPLWCAKCFRTRRRLSFVLTLYRVLRNDLTPSPQ